MWALVVRPPASVTHSTSPLHVSPTTVCSACCHTPVHCQWHATHPRACLILQPVPPHPDNPVTQVSFIHILDKATGEAIADTGAGTNTDEAAGNGTPDAAAAIADAATQDHAAAACSNTLEHVQQDVTAYQSRPQPFSTVSACFRQGIRRWSLVTARQRKPSCCLSRTVGRSRMYGHMQQHAGGICTRRPPPCTHSGRRACATCSAIPFGLACAAPPKPRTQQGELVFDLVKVDDPTQVGDTPCTVLHDIITRACAAGLRLCCMLDEWAWRTRMSCDVASS